MENVKVLINEAKIESRLDELAKEIMRDYKDEDIVFVGVLRGAAMFMVELAKRIKRDGNNIILLYRNHIKTNTQTVKCC